MGQCVTKCKNPSSTLGSKNGDRDPSSKSHSRRGAGHREEQPPACGKPGGDILVNGTKKAEAAADACQLPTSSGDAGREARPGAEAASAQRLEELFGRYRDAREDAILEEGMERLCGDLRVDPTEFRVLLLAWKFQAATMCKFTRSVPGSGPPPRRPAGVCKAVRLHPAVPSRGCPRARPAPLLALSPALGHVRPQGQPAPVTKPKPRTSPRPCVPGEGLWGAGQGHPTVCRAERWVIRGGRDAPQFLAPAGVPAGRPCPARSADSAASEAGQRVCSSVTELWSLAAPPGPPGTFLPHTSPLAVTRNVPNADTPQRTRGRKGPSPGGEPAAQRRGAGGGAGLGGTEEGCAGRGQLPRRPAPQ